MRDFADVQSQLTQHHFSIRQDSAAAQLVARVLRFFQYQGVWDQLRGDLCQVEGGGDPGRAGADNNYGVLVGFGHSYYFISKKYQQKDILIARAIKEVIYTNY